MILGRVLCGLEGRAYLIAIGSAAWYLSAASKTPSNPFGESIAKFTAIDQDIVERWFLGRAGPA